MIVVIVGELGSGKSTMLAGFVSRFASGRAVIDDSSISEEFLTDIVCEGSERICIALDEKYGWYDSRQHMSKANRLFAAAVRKIKYTGCHVFITAQEFSMVDKRVRCMTDFIIGCERIENEDCG